MPATLSLSQARRIALAAQGFADPRPEPFGATMRHLQRVIDRLQVVQIDSVNVLARSHYLPFFARLGPYDPALLDRARDGAGPRARGGRRLVESWAHMASLIPPGTWPYLGFRMQRAAEEAWSGSIVRDHPGVLETVREVVREQGPLTAREVDAIVEHDVPRETGNWGWNWSLVKYCLEHLFFAGHIVAAGRNAQFERRYADPSWVLPPEVLSRAPGQPGAPDPEESAVELMRRSVRAHGIGSLLCLRDYFRLPVSMAAPALAELVRRGEVEEVTVDGWDRPLFLDAAARRPRRVRARALLSPFDSLVWQRERTEELFGFRYRIEIYVPEPKRVYGYYVLPFLLGEELVGRVDLKADRARGALVARAIHFEPDAPQHAADELMEELRLMADWLRLDRVEVV